LGLRLPTWKALLQAMIDLAARDDAALSRALPLGYSKRSGKKALAARAAEQLRGAAKGAGRALEHLASDVAGRPPPVAPEQLAQVMRSREVGPESILGVRPLLRVRVERAGDRVKLHCRDVVIDLPAHAEPAVRHAVRSA